MRSAQKSGWTRRRSAKEEAVGPADVLHAPIGELMPHRRRFRWSPPRLSHLLHLRRPAAFIHFGSRIPRQTARQADARADDNVVLLSPPPDTT